MLTKEFAAVDNGTMTVSQIERDAQGNIIAGTDTTVSFFGATSSQTAA